VTADLVQRFSAVDFVRKGAEALGGKGGGGRPDMARPAVRTARKRRLALDAIRGGHRPQ